MPNYDTVTQGGAAWETQRNQNHVTADWPFTAAGACLSMHQTEAAVSGCRRAKPIQPSTSRWQADPVRRTIFQIMVERGLNAVSKGNERRCGWSGTCAMSAARRIRRPHRYWCGGASTVGACTERQWIISALIDRLFVYQMDYCRGLQRVSPEWYWRDFRLRLSHGRNHGSEQRLERAALPWAVYHNFEAAQRRSERKRHYRHPGMSALQVAGVPPGEVSYLDALGV